MADLDLDTIHAALSLNYDREVKIVASWTFHDAGMAPITVVVYDLPGYWDGPRGIEHAGSTARGIITIQGTRRISNEFIDYMEGW